MRRVYLIWACRLVLGNALFRLFAALGVVGWLSVYVSPIIVWSNTPKSLWRGSTYTLAAFWETEFVAQFLILSLVLLAGWLFFDGFRFLVSVYQRVVRS